MRITVNGQPVDCAAQSTVRDLLATLHVDPTQVVVERNADIVAADRYEATLLADDDCLEIFHFVGGG